MTVVPPAAPNPGAATRFARRTALTCLIGAILLADVTDGRATRDRPPTAVTGGFGEPTCQFCHFEAELDTGPGALMLQGVPDQYNHGETYTLTLTLVHPNVAAAGFEIASRFDQSAAQAGTLAAQPDHHDRIEITIDNHIQYAHHLRPGTLPSSGDTARWRLHWTAPSRGGSVVLHAVANAANDDDSPLGDYVYSASATTRPRAQPR